MICNGMIHKKQNKCLICKELLFIREKTLCDLLADQIPNDCAKAHVLKQYKALIMRLPFPWRCESSLN